eukprot:1159468-Pelagomonas_calceolata.AAC.3
MPVAFTRARGASAMWQWQNPCMAEEMLPDHNNWHSSLYRAVSKNTNYQALQEQKQEDAEEHA